jgi:hypothetical protein
MQSSYSFRVSRPFFRKTIHELKVLVEASANSPDTLKDILAELIHRQRPRAVALKVLVEETLKGAAAEAEKSVPEATQDGPARIIPRGAGEITPAEARRSSFKDDAAPPSQFTLVQNIDVKGRPAVFRPTLKNDLRLDVTANDPPAKVYRVVIFELIREMRRKKVGRQQFTIEDGERVSCDSSGYSYKFDFVEEANLFEGAKVEIIIGGRVVHGNITALLQGQIIVTLQEDSGETIAVCVLRIDNTALLQALHDRLEKIERGEVTAFRADFAGRVLRNDAAATTPAPAQQWPWEWEPTLEQVDFIRLALTNEITWLWGPPGTGKTAALSVLIYLLHTAGKRVLICSNTNHAVDQVLLQLCQQMQKADRPELVDGKVVRLGRIAHENLESEFEKFITVENIVLRKSENLVRRKLEIESLLGSMGREVEYAEDFLKKFTKSDVAKAAVASAEQQLDQSRAKCDLVTTNVQEAKSLAARFAIELEKRRQAGTFRRLMMRSDVTITGDLAGAKSRVAQVERELVDKTRWFNEQKTSTEKLRTEAKEAFKAVAGEDRSRCEHIIKEYDARRQPLRDELVAIAAQMEDIRNSVLREARVVGATVTRTFLRPTEFALFDVVVVDEASMLLIPTVFHAAGLSTQQVVIAGDFRQLPPIVQTEQQIIHDRLANDIFHEAGIAQLVQKNVPVPHFIMLKQQFRMDPELCKVISSAFYGGLLTTSPQRVGADSDLPELLNQRFTIVDTSRVWPFTSRNTFNSRFNLMHALACRNIVLHLHDLKCLTDRDGKGTIGLCTPFAAQAKLLREILRGYDGLHKIVRASTAHGFRGDERKVMVLDLVDSVGERYAGMFLQADHLEHPGAKLLNVALSRAKESIIIVGNLTFLDAKLPNDAILRSLLYNLQRTARILDVRDILALRPIFDDLKRFGPQPELDPEALRTGLFGGRDFARIARLDMESATECIVIYSGFITPNRVADMGDLLRRKIASGIKVRCITRPPRRNGSIPEDQGRSALHALEAIGVVVDLRSEIHEKAVLIDGKLAWFGSLNPLSHTPRTSELMARVENPAVAIQIASLLSIRKQSFDTIKTGGFAAAENPRCGDCHRWTVLVRGKYGLFFTCEGNCEWKQNVF